MKINSIQNYNNKQISFKSTGSREASLSLQNPDVIAFKNNMEMTGRADAVQSNPLKAFAVKILKAVKVFFKPRFDSAQSVLDTPALNQLIAERALYY